MQHYIQCCIKSMKKFKILICLILIVIAGSFTACGKEEIPELAQSKLEDMFAASVKQDMYFDQISNITLQEVETSQSDIENLQTIFPIAVPYKTIFCTANISSISMDAYIEYKMVVAYNAEWKVVDYYAVNESNWEYDAKEFVNLKQIMNDLKKINVGPFKAGYCGNEKKSTLTIYDRVEDKSINRETIYCTLTIDTDFGYYKVDLQAIYYFKKGNWVIGDFVIPDTKEWDFTFNKDSEIRLFDDIYIKKKLNTKSEFLTYIVDPTFIEDSALVLDSMVATEDTVTYNYIYNVSYKNIGDVYYNVRIKYDWLSFEWGEGLLEIELKSQDFSKLIEQKYISGDVYFIIDDVVDYSEDIELNEDDKVDTRSQFFYITYFDGQTSYNLLCNMLISLRDNNYDLKLKKVFKNGEEVKRFNDFNRISFRVSNNSLYINGIGYYTCESSELLYMKFINENDLIKYFFINEVNSIGDDESIKFTYFDGEEEKTFDAILEYDSTYWNVSFVMDEEIHSFVIYNDDPYFIKYMGESYYTQEIIDLKQRQSGTSKISKNEEVTDEDIEDLEAKEVDAEILDDEGSESLVKSEN